MRYDAGMMNRYDGDWIRLHSNSLNRIRQRKRVAQANYFNTIKVKDLRNTFQSGPDISDRARWWVIQVINSRFGCLAARFARNALCVWWLVQMVGRSILPSYKSDYRCAIRDTLMQWSSNGRYIRKSDCCMVWSVWLELKCEVRLVWGVRSFNRELLHSDRIRSEIQSEPAG